MRTTMYVLAVAATMGIAPRWANPQSGIAQELLTIERQVMDGWLNGNPDPATAVADPQITFIHDALGRPIEGLPALKAALEQFRGVPLFERYEILNPKVHAAGEAAVLTYQLVQHTAATARYWNGTLVYQKKKEGWRLIHSHWSAVNGQ